MTPVALVMVLVGAALIYAGITGTSPINLLTGRSGVRSTTPKTESRG